MTVLEKLHSIDDKFENFRKEYLAHFRDEGEYDRLNEKSDQLWNEYINSWKRWLKLADAAEKAIRKIDLVSLRAQAEVADQLLRLAAERWRVAENAVVDHLREARAARNKSSPLWTDGILCRAPNAHSMEQ